MADMKTIADLLVLNNKKLDQLTKDNEKSDSVTSIIAHSLPEILSDQQIAGRQEKFDKREGVTEVDEFVVTNTDAVNKLGSEYLSKLIPQIKTSAAASTKLLNSAFLQFNNRAAASAILAQRGYSKSLTVFGNALTVDDIDKRKLEKEEFEKNISERKNELEKLGIIATDNLGFNKLQYESDKAELRFRLKTAESPAKKKEIKEDLRKLNKDQGSRLQKIGAGIGNLVESGKKGAKLGIKAFFSTIGLGVLLIALGTFFQSKTFKKITDSLQGLITLFTGKDKEGNPVGLFDRIKGIFSPGGALVAGIALLVGAFTFKSVALMLLPLRLGFKAIRGAFRMFGGQASKTAAGARAGGGAPRAPRAPLPRSRVGRLLGLAKRLGPLAARVLGIGAAAAGVAALAKPPTPLKLPAPVKPPKPPALPKPTAVSKVPKVVSGALSKVGVGPAATAASKVVASGATKSVAKVGGKALLKGAIRAVPGIGLLAGLLFAGQKALAGDFVGAGMEIAAGAAGLLPVVGTGFSLAISAGIAARDLGAFDSATEKPPPPLPEKSNKLSTGASATAKGSSLPKAPSLAPVRGTLASGDVVTLPDGTMVTKDDPRRVKDSVVAHLPEAERADAKKAVILSNNLNMRMNDLRTLANEAGRKAKNFEESGENIGAELERIEQKRLIGKFEELRAMDIDLRKEFPLKRDAPKVAPKVGTGMPMSMPSGVASSAGTGMPMSMPTGSDPTGVNKATGSANAATPTNLSTGASPTGKGKSGVASSGLAKKLAEIQAKRKALQSKRKTLGGGRGLSKEMQEAMGGRYPSMDGQTNIVDAKGQASLAQGKIESANLMRQENEIKLMMDAGKSSSADGKGGTTVVNNVSAPQNSSVTTTGRSGSNTIKNNKYGRLNINLPGSGLDM